MNLNNTKAIYNEELINYFLFPLKQTEFELRGESNIEKKFQKRLRLQNDTDWKKYQACVDLLVDCDYAIIDVYEYGLSVSASSNVGEMYLRLYGILNAVYLQIGALKGLSNLLNYNIHEVLGIKLEELEVYRFRNIIGAHTIDYLYDESFNERQTGQKKKTSFRITQTSLSKYGGHIMAIDENNNILYFNLFKSLDDYLLTFRKLIIELLNQMTGTIVKGKYRQELKKEIAEKKKMLLNYSYLRPQH